LFYEEMPARAFWRVLSRRQHMPSGWDRSLRVGHQKGPGGRRTPPSVL